MKNSLYEEFNCKNKEELYEKIRNQDEDIKPLMEFFDYVKANIKNNRQAISSPDTLVDYVKSTTLPTIDVGTIIFVNTQKHPVHLNRIRLSRKSSIKETLREGLMAGANDVFLAFSNETPNKRVEETKEYFEKIGMKIIDTIGYNKENNSFLSKVAGEKYYASKTYEIARDSETSYGDKDYSLKDKYEDFTSYFASNELINLNVVENVEEIKEVLKIGFQHHQQEIFGVLIYDSNEKIIGAEELFKGATDAAIVDLKIIARSLFNYQDVKGMAVFHNHPSGNPTPSSKDIEMTNKIKNFTEIFEIELLDHFIVGKEKTLSFLQEVDSFQSGNRNYQDKQEEIYDLFANAEDVEAILEEDEIILTEKAFIYTQENMIEKEITKEANMADEKGKKIEIIQSARSAKWKNEKDEVIDIFVQKQPDGKNMLAFGKGENYGNSGKYDNSDGSFTLLSEYTDGLYWSFCYPDQTERLTLEEQKIFNDVMEKYNPDFKKTVSEQLSKNVFDGNQKLAVKYGTNQNIDVRKTFNLAHDLREDFIKEKEIAKEAIMAEERIEFIEAKRTSWYEVEAVYSLNNENFSVFWNCIDEQTGKPDFYYLANKVESKNEDLTDRVLETIKMGEDDYNKDLELYLAIRDTYDKYKAEDETHKIEIKNVSYYDKISLGLEVDAYVDGEDMSFFMQLPITDDSQISVINGHSDIGWDLLTEIASHAEKTFESNLDIFLLTQGLEKDNLKEIGDGVYLIYDTDENDVKVINKSSVSNYYNTAVYEFIDLRNDYSLNDDIENLEEKIQAFKNENELAVEEPEKWNLVNDKKRQEFYNKIGIDPTEPLFAEGKSLQDITIEVNEPVYEPEDYNTPDRKLTLSADDVLADAFMSYEKYEEGMPFPGWYQYEKDIPLAEIKNIDDFLSEKNFAFNYDHNIDVRKIFNLARDSREAFLKENYRKTEISKQMRSLPGPYDPSTGEKTKREINREFKENIKKDLTQDILKVAESIISKKTDWKKHCLNCYFNDNGVDTKEKTIQLFQSWKEEAQNELKKGMKVEKNKSQDKKIDRSR